MPLTLQEKLEAKYAPTEHNIKNPPFLTRKVYGEEYIPLDMSITTEDDEKRSTSLSEILMIDSPYKTLFEGVLGIGKSTTLTQILELYDRKRFDHVLQIKLDLLLNSKWKDDYEKINLRHYPLACLAHASLEQIIHGRGKINANYIKLKEIIELFEQDNQSRTLLIVDGFDKISHLIGEKYIKEFISQILEFDNVFMSARPRTMVNFIKDLFDNIVTINGINGEKIKLFIKKYFIAQSNFLKSEVERLFNDDQLVIRNVEELLFSLKSKSNPASSEASRQLEKILGEHLELTDTVGINRKIEEYYILKTDTILNLEKTNHAIHELLSNPMHATMICMQDIVSETLTLAELYRGVINRLGERFIPIEEVIREEPIETLKELQILKKLAYKSLANGDLSWQDINEELGEESNIDRLLRVGILQSITSTTTLQRNTYHSERDFGRISERFDSRTFKFIDRSILEYLAACEFKDRLMLEKGSALAKEAAEFIASHRHETKYLTFLKFTAGEISKLDNNSQDEVPIAMIRFWEAVECVIHETVETAIDKPIILWMNLLSQVMINKQPDPRIPNLSQIIDIIDTAIINDFIRWKTVIVSSGYLSPRIQEFLEQHIASLSPRVNEILDNSESDNEDTLSSQKTNHKTIQESPYSSEIILEMSNDDIKSEASHRSSIISADMTSVEYAIETYGYLYNLVENNHMFDLLFTNFCTQDNKRIIKYIIIAIARIIKNHHITDDRIYKFQNKLEEYNNDEYLSSSVGKALLAINAESEGLSSTNLRSESTVIETGSKTLLSQQRTPFERPPLEHSDTNLKRLLSSSLKDLSLSLKKNKSTDTIQVLINNLLTNPYWIEERWEIRMEALLEISGISNGEMESSINPTLKRLSIITNKALQAHIYLVNDNSNLEWFYNNFEHLRSLAKIGFDSIIDSFTYQIFSDNYITPQESRFICLCITAQQLSIIIKPPKLVNGEPQYIIVYNGREYILHGFYNAKQVEKIIETAIENKAEVPVLKNTGSGIRIAASNLPCYSMVDRSELSSEETLITWCYRTSHLLSEPTGVFILLERKSKHFGQYVVTKISVKDDGSLRVYPDYYRHPNDINSSFRVSVFGAMIYTDHYKIRYRTDSVAIDQEMANDILITAKRYSTDEYLEHSDILSKRTSRSLKLKNTEKLYQEQILSINDKIKILHSLITDIDGIEITGDWSQDLAPECKLIEHDKNIIDAVDVQRTDSFRIMLNEHSAAIESFEKFTRDLNLEALTKVISSEEAKEHAREEMIAIEGDIYKHTVYQEVVLKINAFYIAVNAIYSEMIKSDNTGAAGRIGSLLGKLGPHVPLLGPVVEFMGEIFTEIDGVIASERIENFVHFALTGGEMAEISDKLARKILHYDLDNIQPSARTIITQASSTITNLVDNGPAKIIVQACKTFRNHLEEHFIDEEEQEENELKNLGKKHAEIITKAIIESIFTKSYDPKIKVGTIMKGAAITAAKVVKNDNEFKASSIIKLMVEKYELHKLDGQTSEEHRDSLNEANEDEHTREPNLVPAGYDIPPSSGGLGCGGGKCTIMAMTGATFDNPQIEAAFNQENSKEVISALQEINNKARIESKELKIDSDKIINLYADAQRLYGKEAVTQIYNFIQNNEEAKKLLILTSIIGNEATLKTIFGESNEDSIKDFENIITAEYEEGNGGISQYIHNARFGENAILSTARNLIKYITNMYNKFQEMLYNEEYGDKLFAIQDQLQLLLTYAEKGQPTIPLGRPHRGSPDDDDDYGGNGGGGSSLFFEGNNGESDNNFAEIIPHYYPSLNETKFRKLLIEIKSPEEQDYSS